MLLKNVKKEEKTYLEELIKPLDKKYLRIEKKFGDIQLEFKEIIKYSEYNSKLYKRQFKFYVGLVIGLAGLFSGLYISNSQNINQTNIRLDNTNIRIDQTYNLILEQDKKYHQMIKEFNLKYETLLDRIVDH